MEEYNEQIEGRNAVLETLKSGNDINKLYIQKGNTKGSINEIIRLAKNKKVVIMEIDKQKMDAMSETHNHQGVIAKVPPFNYADVDDILDLAKEKRRKPFIIMLDKIEDPHNLGSIIRTAECVGADGIIIPKRHCVNVNATVMKTSAGAASHVLISRVTNLNDTIKYLKENDVWVYATEMNANKNYYDEDYTDSGVCLLIGNEGSGISRLVKENSDFLIKIPMNGKINSLNASVSAGIVMYEIFNQRMKK